MINNNIIMVVDYETSDVNPLTLQPLSLAGKAINPRTLKPFSETEGEFYSLIKPTDFSKLSQKAMEINKLSIEDLKQAPELKQVWDTFVDFVNRFNKKPGNHLSAPIMAGHNIRNFDLVITNRLCLQYGTVDKDKLPNLFSRRFQIDSIDLLLSWFENSKEPENFKLDTIRQFLGMTGESVTQAHNSLQDVRDTGNIITKFLNLHRNLCGRIKFKGAFNAIS